MSCQDSYKEVKMITFKIKQWGIKDWYSHLVWYSPFCPWRWCQEK